MCDAISRYSEREREGILIAMDDSCETFTSPDFQTSNHSDKSSVEVSDDPVELAQEQMHDAKSPDQITGHTHIVTAENKSGDVSTVLSLRKQPLMELVHSEESYVRRLRMVKDHYIPIISTSKAQCQVDGINSSTTPGGNTVTGPVRDGSVQSSLPSMPDDLTARWRIVWGNWIQLCEWHSAFLEKLKVLVETDPDKIPRLFIDSRARLRSIYSKYCENHRKAALITEQYRDYFEELRIYLNDKEDVVSYLMQPVQRIMRYQLPMAEIVKYTERSHSTELYLWRKALDIMKEIPKDTQLILEAARIDGFPGVITALGNILIRGDLLVATATREQLLETVTGYKGILQELTRALGLSDPSSPLLSALGLSTQSSRSTAPNCTATSPSPGLGSPTSTLPSLANTTQLHDGVATVSDPSGLYTGNLKFVESRLFLFEQMLVVTEEIRLKRRAASTDAFSQSIYQFRAAINVNKMRFEPHWYNCNLPNGHTNADAAAVDQLLSLGLAPDDLRFAIHDQTPGRDVMYIIDPTTCANREAWVVQLRDIQRMQHEFLLALQDPRRFNTGNRDDSWTISPSSSTENSHLLASPLDPQPPIVSIQNSQPNSQPRQRKWPSFTMKRPGRLGSASSPTSSKDTLTMVGTKASFPVPFLPDASNNERKNSQLARSLSAERGATSRTKLDVRPSVSEAKFLPSGEPNPSYHRKSSLGTSNSLKVAASSLYSDGLDSFDGCTAGGKTGGNVVKMRSVFANLFGRNKSKQRGKHADRHTPQLVSSPEQQPHPIVGTSVHDLETITTANESNFVDAFDTTCAVSTPAPDQ